MKTNQVQIGLAHEGFYITAQYLTLHMFRKKSVSLIGGSL